MGGDRPLDVGGEVVGVGIGPGLERRRTVAPGGPVCGRRWDDTRLGSHNNARLGRAVEVKGYQGSRSTRPAHPSAPAVEHRAHPGWMRHGCTDRLAVPPRSRAAAASGTLSPGLTASHLADTPTASP